ncbi:NAD(P)H-dependent oxidoreductase [Roseobacter sp. WL0113]|uniref:NAD(P)H-dependent oxidoreductase n=2 Tax=Roseobacter sinensis TaxID=2931391 RepID=A0ABT3BE39_9RHOB|nr:NAD(P)H-dependent oxidoreductase [Roseobacter sp. WL0113]
MSGKRIFVLNGHPAQTSLNRHLAETYAAAARKAGHEVRLTHLADMEFDPDHGFAGYAQHKPLEAVLQAFRSDVEWAEHMVLTTPMWWGGLPAKLKGLIDRTFLPGWAFDTRNRNRIGMPRPMLGGRTARAIVTSDSPDLFFALMYRKALLRQIRGQIFNFVGMRPAKTTHLAPVGEANAGTIEGWQRQIDALGAAGR